MHLRRTAYLLCGDWHRAEDIVQTTLTRVVVAARRRGVENLDAYTRTVLARVYLDERRRLPWRRESPLADAATVPQPAGDQALSVTLLAALRTLPPRQRAAVVLRYWEDRSTEETAEALGVSPGTVKSQCAMAGVATIGVLVAAGAAITGRPGGPGPDGDGAVLTAGPDPTAISSAPVAPSVLAPVSLLHTLRDRACRRAEGAGGPAPASRPSDTGRRPGGGDRLECAEPVARAGYPVGAGAWPAATPADRDQRPLVGGRMSCRSSARLRECRNHAGRAGRYGRRGHADRPRA